MQILYILKALLNKNIPPKMTLLLQKHPFFGAFLKKVSLFNGLSAILSSLYPPDEHCGPAQTIEFLPNLIIFV